MAAKSEDQVALLIRRFPGPLQLRPSPAKWLLILAICLLFVVCGAAFILTPETFSHEQKPDLLSRVLISLGLVSGIREAIVMAGWATVIFFGAGCLVSAVVLLPGASVLTLDVEGLLVRSLFRGFKYRWDDVDEFTVVNVVGREMVGMNMNQLSAAQSAFAAMNVKLTGRNGALPDTYGLQAMDLAQLLTLWRARALGETAGTGSKLLQ